MGEVLQKKIVQYAKEHLGKRVWDRGVHDNIRMKGNGVCWDLAYTAIIKPVKENGMIEVYEQYVRNVREIIVQFRLLLLPLSFTLIQSKY